MRVSGPQQTPRTLTSVIARPELSANVGLGRRAGQAVEDIQLNMALDPELFNPAAQGEWTSRTFSAFHCVFTVLIAGFSLPFVR